MSQPRYRKVTSGSGKSHLGRRITMAQPVSSVIAGLVKSSRSIAHSDDFEGHKSIQTISWQQILSAWIYYIGVLLRVTKASSSKQAAASKQHQPAYARLKKWLNKSTKNHCNTQIEFFPGARGCKTMIYYTVTLLNSCGDAKIELFPGARFRYDF